MSALPKLSKSGSNFKLILFLFLLLEEYKFINKIKILNKAIHHIKIAIVFNIPLNINIMVSLNPKLLIDIANLIEQPVWDLYELVNKLLDNKILQEII